MSKNSLVKKKIKEILTKKNLSIRNLSKLIDHSPGSFNEVVNGKKSFSKIVIKKLLPILEVSEEEFNSWILADKYPRELIELAVKNRKEFPYKRKRLLTTKIDAILREKYMSRADLATQVKYSQSTLNKMIIGKRNVSKSVLKRISEALETPQDEILSWIIADKYSLESLEEALAEK